jgi:TDG/mug DNA glycosylase family protein
MTRIRSFDPIETRSAEILILGSMPGAASLAAGQYYAHPRNAFWRIMSALLQFDAAAPYASRVRALKIARIALWDVLHSCTREGSLDSSIDRDSQAPNDFEAFFRTHRKISRVYFNGAKAESCFRQHVLRNIDIGAVACTRLPSTSPAHASLSFPRKLSAWRVIIDPRQRVRRPDR